MEPRRQVEICQRALNVYINAPHRTNLYIYEEEYKKDPDGLHKANDYNKNHWVVSDPTTYHFNTKIRWSNIGQQYDWDHRTYF